MLIVCLINSLVALMFFVLGFLFSRGKGAFLIAGYNTSSREYKNKIDEKALCKAMSKMMYALAFSWLIVSLGCLLENNLLTWLGIAIFLAVIIAGLIYMNTGHRFEKK